MRSPEQIGCQVRALHPRGGGQESGDRKQDSRPDQDAPDQSEGCPGQAVGPAQAHGPEAPAEEASEQVRGDRGSSQNEQKTAELRQGRRGDEAAQSPSGVAE